MIAIRQQHPQDVDLLVAAGPNGTLAVPVQITTGDGAHSITVEGANFLRQHDDQYHGSHVLLGLLKDSASRDVGAIFWEDVEASARLNPDSPQGRLYAYPRIEQVGLDISFDDNAMRRWIRTEVKDTDVVDESYVFRMTKPSAPRARFSFAVLTCDD